MAHPPDQAARAVASVPAGPAQPLMTSGHEFVCGWGAAFVNISITYPINKIMFRQMLHGVSMVRALSQLRQEGFSFLYRGVLPPLFQKTVSVSLMFGMYEQYRRQFYARTPFLGPTLCDMSAAVMAGATEALLTPFERVQVLMQDRHYHARYANTWHAARELRAHGVPEYYRGMVPILVRNGASNILFFGLRTRLKEAMPSGMTRTTAALYDFSCGALLGAVISTVMYPLNVVKTHMQSRVGGPYRGVMPTVWEVYVARGRSLRALFRGVHVNYTRSLISWGIINCTYEFLKTHLT